MRVFEKSSNLEQHLAQVKSRGETVGFVPTMGALHQGHLSLIETSTSQCDLTVCSVFVNPTQFNDLKDLEKYPRTVDADIDLLNRVNCDILFLPSVEEIYPNGMNYELDFDPGYLDRIMEGTFRPNHFKGVAQVVYRLLELVKPTSLFMGLKDFQQLAVVKKLINDLNLNVNLVACETIREQDGLAMSSRNARLSPEMRGRARAIYDTLKMCREWVIDLNPSEIQFRAFNKLKKAGLNPEYFELINPETFQMVKEEIKGPVVACVAAHAGDVRLIDNMLLDPQSFQIP